MSSQISLARWTLVGALTASLGCALPADEASGDETTLSDAVIANSNYSVKVKGSVEIKEKIFFTKTVATPAITDGIVTLGPEPARCHAGPLGIEVCQRTMIWRAVTVNTFTVEGKTVKNLQVSTLVPITINVAQNKFTVPANTARFVLTGTVNNSPFYAERGLDSDITGTFAPGGQLTISGTASRTIKVGPISARVWGNFKFGGTVTNPAPICKSTGTNQYSCEPGGTPVGVCQATKLHRTVVQCNGSSKSSEQIIDLVATGYGNYTCTNRFAEQCIDDGSFDAYYSEWCEYGCQ